MLGVSIEQHAVRIGPRFGISFQRTLRIPDDGGTYPLPPGLGNFPVFRVADHAGRLPAEWARRGGVFIPMHQGEALWLGMHGARWKPNAVVVAIGGVNAVSGLAGSERLEADPQNYVVTPNQPWLDGINSGDGAVRQFVAMPLGGGYTVESSVTGAEKTGGLQLTVYEPRPGIFPDEAPPPDLSRPAGRMASMAQPMGLGAGGRLKQKIYPDPHGIAVWDRENYGKLFVHILNSAQFREVTGSEPPPTPVDAALYARHRLPWFDLYDERRGDVAPAPELAAAKTIAERDAELGRPPSGPPSIDRTSLPVTKLSNEPAAGRGARPSDSRHEDHSSGHE